MTTGLLTELICSFAYTAVSLWISQMFIVLCLDLCLNRSGSVAVSIQVPFGIAVHRLECESVLGCDGVTW